MTLQTTALSRRLRTFVVSYNMLEVGDRISEGNKITRLFCKLITSVRNLSNIVFEQITHLSRKYLVCAKQTGTCLISS